MDIGDFDIFKPTTRRSVRKIKALDHKDFIWSEKRLSSKQHIKDAGVCKPGEKTPFEDSTSKRPNNIIHNISSANDYQPPTIKKHNENTLHGPTTPDENVVHSYQTGMTAKKSSEKSTFMSKILSITGEEHAGEYGDTLPLEDQIFVDSELYVTAKPDLKTYKKKAPVDRCSSYFNIKTYGNPHKQDTELIEVIPDNSVLLDCDVKEDAYDNDMNDVNSNFSEEDLDFSSEDEYQNDEEHSQLSPIEIVEMSECFEQEVQEENMVDPLIVEDEKEVENMCRADQQVDSMEPTPFVPSMPLTTTSLSPQLLPGDIVWGKISGKYMYWPCIIMNSQHTNFHYKLTGKPVGYYHVHFYADNGRRSWICSSNMLPYKGLEDLRKGYKVPWNLLSRKNPDVPTVWQKAVAEADVVLHLTRLERIASFLRENPHILPTSMQLETAEANQECVGGLKRKRSEACSCNGDSHECDTKVAEIHAKKKRSIQDFLRIKLVPSKHKLKSPSKTYKVVSNKKKSKTPNKCHKKKCTKITSKYSSSNFKTADSESKNKKVSENRQGGLISIQELTRNRSVSPNIDFVTFYNAEYARLKTEFEMNETQIQDEVAKSWSSKQLKNNITVASTSNKTNEDKVPDFNQKLSKLLQGNCTKICNFCYEGTLTDGQTTLMCKAGCMNFYHLSCGSFEHVNNKLTCHTCRTKSHVCFACSKREKLVIANNLVDNNSTEQKLTDQSTDENSSDEKSIDENSTDDNSTDDNSTHDKSADNKYMHDDSTDNYSTVISTDVNKKCKKVEYDPIIRCKIPDCGKFYHQSCLIQLPQTVINGSDLVCPRHTCHTCVSENPHVSRARVPKNRLVSCILCPTTYHTGEYCIPAGAIQLSHNQIICSKHRLHENENKKRNRVNCNWCFVCCKGGTLLCCESCPTTMHSHCAMRRRTIEKDKDFYCVECQNGNFPCPGQILWVKHGNYRWWPAKVLLSNEIPDNLYHQYHKPGEYVVRFFGTNDYAWTHNQRTFPFLENDDKSSVVVPKSVMVNKFRDGVTKAAAAFAQYQEMKIKRDAALLPKAKPQSFVKLSGNKYLITAEKLKKLHRHTMIDEKDPVKCLCKEHMCREDCLNRSIMLECQTDTCNVGTSCENRMFTRGEYPKLEVFATRDCGWGLRPLENLKQGQFVIEYIGEVIDEAAFRHRVHHNHRNQEENFYFLSLANHVYIDAGPKGNNARFMNHSCMPNCETQKWSVNGELRVGLFTLVDIKAGTELTFDYNLEILGQTKQPCFCFAENCSGYIGKKPKVVKKRNVDTISKSPKKKKVKSCELVESASGMVNILEVPTNDINRNKGIQSIACEKFIKRRSSSKYRTPSPPVPCDKDSLNSMISNIQVSNVTSCEESVLIQKHRSSSKYRTPSPPVPCDQDSLNSMISNVQVSNATSCEESVLVQKRRSSSKYRTPSPVPCDQDIPIVINTTSIAVLPSKRRTTSKYRVLNTSKQTLIQETNTEKSVTSTKDVVFNEGSHSRKTTTARTSVTKKLTRKTRLVHNDDTCYSCEEEGALVSCEQIGCPRTYHLECIPANAKSSLKSLKEASFTCPWHFCRVCDRKSDIKCFKCDIAYCKDHNTFDVTDLHGYACVNHKDVAELFHI